MRTRAGILQRNDTSGIPGVRLRMHRSRWGKPRPELAVRYRANPRAPWLHTSLPATVDGMRRAIALREASIGAVLGVSAAKALRMVRRELFA